jgi:hypothetical protein
MRSATQTCVVEKLDSPLYSKYSVNSQIYAIVTLNVDSKHERFASCAANTGSDENDCELIDVNRDFKTGEHTEFIFKVSSTKSIQIPYFFVCMTAELSPSPVNIAGDRMVMLFEAVPGKEFSCQIRTDV